jgi:hypothetical protein
LICDANGNIAVSYDSFDANTKGRPTESGAAVARGRNWLGLSRRQAYRYLELARAGRPAPPVAENSITITLKMPESLAGDLRAHASKHDLTTSEVIRRAVSAFLAAKRRHV